MSLPPRVKHESLKHVKKVFRAVAARGQHSEWVAQLPSEPAVLATAHPAVYAGVFGGTAPAPCPLDIVMLGNLTQSIPMRITSRLMAADPLAVHDTVGSSRGQQKQRMNALMSCFQQMVAGSPQLDIQLLGSRAQPALPSNHPHTPPKAVLPPALALPAPAAVGSDLAEDEENAEEEEEEEEVVEPQQAISGFVVFVFRILFVMLF